MSSALLINEALHWVPLLGLGISAAIVGVGSALGGVASIMGANKAADAQTKASEKAIQYLQQNFQLTQGNLAPWLQAGTGAVNQLTELTGAAPGGNPLTAPLTAPFQPTMAQLAQTPGYQFTLDQGLKGVQNSAAAKGLGASGEALTGAANYAEGLAGTTYQNQFQNYLSQNQQIYNMLNGLSGVGATAATNLGQIGAGAATGSANAAIGAGNAQAAADNANGQAIGKIIGSLSGIPLSYGYGNDLGKILQNNAGNGNIGASSLTGALFPQLNTLLGQFGGGGGNSIGGGSY